jgi:type IV secretory pathway VirB10-like protein
LLFFVIENLKTIRAQQPREGCIRINDSDSEALLEWISKSKKLKMPATSIVNSLVGILTNIAVTPKKVEPPPPAIPPPMPAPPAAIAERPTIQQPPQALEEKEDKKKKKDKDKDPPKDEDKKKSILSGAFKMFQDS